MLMAVAKGLKSLKERVVFVGGVTIELYVASTAPKPRATDDVDCVVELATCAKYHDLEEELRKLGFKHPSDGRGPICRWIFEGIQVDVMPTEGAVLGFKNRWYADGVLNTRATILPDGQSVQIFSVPYLLASKIEAFLDRGKGDFLASHDLEDVVTVLDGCPNLKEEVAKAPEEVRVFLKKKLGGFLADGRFLDGLQGHLEAIEPRAGKTEKVVQLIRDLTT